MTVTRLVLASLVATSFVAGCGHVSNLAQGGSCGLNQPDENVENSVEGKTARTDGYKGTTLEEAEALAKSRAHTLRVVGEDNTCKDLTDDYSFGRVNVYVEDGVVEAVEAF